VIEPSNGSVIAGTAEAGATVILTDGGGKPIGQATADGNVNWTLTPSTPTRPTVSSPHPEPLFPYPTLVRSICGTADAGATVILTDGNGNPIGQDTAEGSGNWSFTPGTPLTQRKSTIRNTSHPWV
ncbi:hypothetical protein J5N94_00290, partial [Pseudomonas aeruginosa]|uniref:Ig-like domain-containing protein n=1 Tax=Pseudomonas aeruginosa TaxID=287 RepID=UPI001B185731